MSDELDKFHKELLQDIKATQLSEEEGGTLEQIFTQTAIDLLADAGETENVRVAYDEGQLGTKNQHKINAYAEPDNYETLDLFITVFKGSEEPSRLAKDEVDTAAKRIANFYRKARQKNYVNDIEEASEIWEFTRTIANLNDLHENLVRINAIILMDGLYSGKIPPNDSISGCPVFFRVVDLDYLYNITEKSHVPIEIDFENEGFIIPCIPATSKNDSYQSYLAIMPARALATIYERFGSRLLEQNVRSFLQFTGKVNKGMRQTILDEPHMFLAYNNGIAATAESVQIKKTEHGFVISKAEDFQIVNGGQTTASIYHTAKKDKANIDGISVQVKLSVVKNKNKFSEIVSKIAEYSNTQNKVAFSELSSNIPFHVDIEKLSRNYFAPPVIGQSIQTKWFYERARGQYKNARQREGFTKAKQKSFDSKNPRSQMFTKGELAKFVNVFEEVTKNKKLVIGPHIVVRGNEKNYVEFIKHNLIEKPDNVYFEDVVAKAILYKAAEKVYGIKPNALGDLRYITVPYSIAWLFFRTEGKIDLLKIWRNQVASDEMKDLLREIMIQVEKYIKAVATGSLYGEFAKKEDCWNMVKTQSFSIDPNRKIHNDLENSNRPSYRRRLDDDETERIRIDQETTRLREIPGEIWKAIGNWGRDTTSLTGPQVTLSLNLSAVLRKNKLIDTHTRELAIFVLNKVIKDAPEIIEKIGNIEEQTDLLNKVKEFVNWNRDHKELGDDVHRFMTDIATGRKNLDGRNTLKVELFLKRAKDHGFEP